MTDGANADVLIVGAGPAALFSVFQLGLYGLRCHLVDGLDKAGGQCAVLYPDKPIFDVPGFVQIDGGELTERLLAQAAPFNPRFSFGRTVVDVAPQGDGRWQLRLDEGTCVRAGYVILAAGLGLFSMPVEGRTDEAQLVSGPVADWPFARSRGSIAVDPSTFETSCAGIFAIGDACDYPGKVKLILSAFHEAALATQEIRKRVAGAGRVPIEYTTTSKRMREKLGRG